MRRGVDDVVLPWPNDQLCFDTHQPLLKLPFPNVLGWLEFSNDVSFTNPLVNIGCTTTI